MALFLSVIIFFSITVKAFTHMFTLGYLPSPVFQNLLPHEGVIPSLEDDFGVVLLKIGAACMEATQYSGLRNELVGIEERQGPWVEIGASDSIIKRPSPGGFSTEVIQIDVSEPEDPVMESAYWKSMKAFWQAFFNCAWAFAYSLLLRTHGGKKAIELSKKAFRARWWYGPRQWRFWRRAVWAEPPRFQREAALRRMQELLHRRLEERPRPITRTDSTSGSIGASTAVAIPYAQYLRGEVELEDDDEEWVVEDDGSVSSGSQSDAEEDQTLYRDLMAEQSEVDLQPVLLAHLTSSTSSPLTRRRYNALITTSRAPSPAALAEVVQDRRLAMAGKERDDWDDDRRRSCVICTIEPRDTILWPCR